MRQIKGMGVEGVLTRLILKDRSVVSGTSGVVEVPKVGREGGTVGRKGEEMQMFKIPQNKSLKLTTLSLQNGSPRKETMAFCWICVGILQHYGLSR